MDAVEDASRDALQHEAEELRESRARIIAAADAERRSVERELHDGVQQHLVALAVNLQLARQMANADPAALKTLLDEMSRDVREALESVRDLAQRVYPPLLLDRGLAEALRAVAAAAGIPTRVDASELDRYSPEIEATVYFCCLEALDNATRHAGTAARATIRAWDDHGALCFEIVDDGAGFDELATPHGAGLTAMSDRLAALGGQLTVGSEAGRGTRLSGTIPRKRRS